MREWERLTATEQRQIAEAMDSTWDPTIVREIYEDIRKILDTGPRTNMPGQEICEQK